MSQFQESSKGRRNIIRERGRHTQCEENQRDNKKANVCSICKIGIILANVARRRPQ